MRTVGLAAYKIEMVLFEKINTRNDGNYPYIARKYKVYTSACCDGAETSRKNG